MEDEQQSTRGGSILGRVILYSLIPLCIVAIAITARQPEPAPQDQRIAELADAEREIAAMGRELQAQISGESQGVTMPAYLQLQTGMSYDQAVAIIGSPGEELSRNEIAGISTVMYGWTNADGSNMNAMFQDGALIQKAQSGLR